MSNVNLDMVISGLTLEKACSVKASKDSKISKTVNLRVKFDGATLRGVFEKCMGGVVIQWQNGPGRNKFDTWTEKQYVDITFSAPTKVQVDPKEGTLAWAQTASKEELDAYIEQLKAKQVKE